MNKQKNSFEIHGKVMVGDPLMLKSNSSMYQMLSL